METKKTFIEAGNQAEPSAPHLHPSLVENHSETPDVIYRLNRCNAILEELKEEKKYYESTYKKYKTLQKTMYFSQLFCNTTSVTSGAFTAGTLASGFGVVAAVPLGVFGVISGGIGMVFGIFDQKALKKMKKHAKLVQLSQSVDGQILKKYLNDQLITKAEFTEILNMTEKYYTEKEEIRSKSLLVGNIENLKKEFVEKGRKLAYLEAFQNSPKLNF